MATLALDAFTSYVRARIVDALPELVAAPTSPSRVGWENRPSAPPADGASLWVTETNRYGVEQVADDGIPRPVVATPFYQLNIFAPAGGGVSRLDAAYGAVTRAFPLRLPVLDTTGTIEVTCTAAEPGPVGVLTSPAGWATRPARLTFRVFRYADPLTGASQRLAVSGLTAVTFGQRDAPRPVLAPSA